MLIICIIIAVLIILLISLGFFLANYSMNGKNQQTLEEARTWQAEHYDISWYDPLEDARKHPENHRSLLVRKTGFSEFYISLSPQEQQEIIDRTEY